MLEHRSPDHDELKAAYDRDGFVIVRQLLPSEELADLRQNIDRYIRDLVPHLPSTEAFYDLDRSRPESLKQLHRMDQDPYFAAYRQHPAWVALAERLIGEQATAEQPEWFNKPPQSQSGTPPHQDNYYFCLRPCNVATIWMALDEIDEENACMRYVAGSHRLGVRPHARTRVLGFSQGISDYGPDDTARETSICLNAGDVAVHHGELIHRAGANHSSTRHRRAFALVFRGISCRRDETAFARYQISVQTQQQSLGAV